MTGPARNRFCDLVGCRLPLQLAGMLRVVSPSLVAAVSEAGGLGMLAIGRQGPAVIDGQLDELLELTVRPVGATFIVKFLDPATFERVVERLAIIELFWGWPDGGLVRPGVVTGWQVGSVEEAKAAVDAGCSYVVAQGVEAGGHVRGTTPMLEIVRSVRAAVDVAVVAAGGIGTRGDVLAAFDAGADAVRVGTRFVAALESDAHQSYVDALVGASAVDTVLTEAFGVGWPNAPHRVLASALAAAEATTTDPIGAIVASDGSQTLLPRFGTTPPNRFTTGELGAMALYAGTSVEAVTGRVPAAQIVRELMEE
jgi:nitronate monooxygenase